MKSFRDVLSHLTFCFFLLGILLLPACEPVGGDDPETTRDTAPEARESATAAGPSANKLDADLRSLVEIWERSPEEAILYAEAKGYRIQDGQVLVTIEVFNADQLSDLELKVHSLGGEVGARAARVADAWIPVGALLELVDLEEVVEIRPPTVPRHTDS